MSAYDPGKRAKLMFWLAALVLAAFLVPQIIMAWYQGTTGKLPI